MWHFPAFQAKFQKNFEVDATLLHSHFLEGFVNAMQCISSKWFYIAFIHDNEVHVQDPTEMVDPFQSSYIT
jgi:hypothetical protein